MAATLSGIVLNSGLDIAKVSVRKPGELYFLFLEKSFLDQRIPKTFHFILKTEALLLNDTLETYRMTGKDSNKRFVQH